MHWRLSWISIQQNHNKLRSICFLVKDFILWNIISNSKQNENDKLDSVNKEKFLIDCATVTFGYFQRRRVEQDRWKILTKMARLRGMEYNWYQHLHSKNQIPLEFQKLQNYVNLCQKVSIKSNLPHLWNWYTIRIPTMKTASKIDSLFLQINLAPHAVHRSHAFLNGRKWRHKMFSWAEIQHAKRS